MMPSVEKHTEMEYLAQLLLEKKEVEMFSTPLTATGRLLDNEIEKVRLALFESEFEDDELELPEAEGPIVLISEKVFIPCKEHPDYNFVGRILGPRGMTAKQLERKTGCRIMIRGKNSLRDDGKESEYRDRPHFEHLKEELHVLVQCEDTEERATLKLDNAVRQVKKLLIPPPTKGIDDLKRKQLTELSILNGTYRPAPASSPMSKQGSPVPPITRHHAVIPVPSTPSAVPIIYATASPPSIDSHHGMYVPPQRRQSQQLQMLTTPTPCASALENSPSPMAYYAPSALESPGYAMDPSVEDLARALDELNFHQAMGGFGAHFAPIGQFVSVTAPCTPCKQPTSVFQTPRKGVEVGRAVAGSARKALL